MYLDIKSVHIIAVVILIAGMLLMALALQLALRKHLEKQRAFLEMTARWDGLVTTPALAVVWMAGIAMAFSAGWDDTLWFGLKLVPVSLLTVLHSVEGLALRRFIERDVPIHPAFAHLPAVILLIVASVVWLAVTKPF